MCYADIYPAEVWNEAEVRARKPHRCESCRLTIARGVRYVRITMLDEGVWTRMAVHADCYALTTHIQRVVCEQHVVCVVPGDQRHEVAEHREHREVVSMYRRVVRARMREGVWPARRGARPEQSGLQREAT